MNNQEMQQLAEEALGKIAESLGFQVKTTVVAPEDPEKNTFKLIVETEKPQHIIGKKGQTLEALETILNRILKKNQEEAPWVALEIDGYSTGRTGNAPEHKGEHGRRHILDDETVEQLTNMALDCAKEVKHWKTSKKLGPYLPAERRVIHTALKDNEFVTTNSIPAPEAGDRMKYVEIILK